MFQKITKYPIYITILLIPAYLIRFSIFGIPTNFLEVLILVTFIASLLYGEKLDWHNFVKHNKIYIFCIALILAGLLISTLVNENYRAEFGIIKSWFIIPLIFAWILYKEIKTREDLKIMLKWLYFGIFGVALSSLAYCFQSNFTYDGRLGGFYLSPNYLAMYLAPAVFIGLYFIKDQSLKTKTFYPVSLLAIISSLYLTYSYATWIAIALSLVTVNFIKYNKINKKTILVGIIILLLIIASQWNSMKFENIKAYSRSSLESRIMIWKSAIKIIEDNPFLGIGPGNFQSKYLEYQKYFPLYLEWAVPQPHNLYLAFWLETGILGLAGFIILIYKWIVGIFKIIKNRLAGIDITVVLAGIMLYILIHGLVDTPYWKNDLAIVFWLIFSLGIISANISHNYELSHPKN